MLSKEDNERLCRVGPGTPMGSLMREYWLPALPSTDLPATDGPPLRLRLLGEDLIAFRTTSGRAGLIQNACPHRGASLFFGRNEEDGLRCVYHGWKFDTTGACVDMPSEPAESNFKTKVRTTAYSCVERGGIVWAYMGPRQAPPPLPELEINLLEEGAARPSLTLMEANWLQTIEGDLDTCHLGFLHLGSVSPEDAVPGSYDYYTVKDRAPRYSVAETDFGVTYAAYRPADGDDLVYWRIAHFMFPFYTLIPTGALGAVIRGQFWVPLDDENTMYWGFSVGMDRGGRPGQGATAANAATGRPAGAAGRGGFEYLPATSDWLGRYRLNQNRENDYLIDREKQRTGEIWTGVRGVRQQDKVVTESMGPIYERTREHLGTSDTMIIRTRQRLLRAVKAYVEDGTLPPGLDSPGVYRSRSGSIILPRGVDWIEATEKLRRPDVPPGVPVTQEGVAIG